MKNKFFRGLLATLMLFGCFSFTACQGDRLIAGIHMANEERVDVPYGNFSYDGVKVIVDYENGENSEIDLTNEMISEKEQLKFFKMGHQDVEVTYRSKYTTTMPINVVLNKFNDVYVLNGYTCSYDGLPHAVTLNHELPEGASITFPYGNVFTNAGTYNITGVIAKPGYESKTLTTTLVIEQANRDTSKIVFEDVTLTYDKTVKTIEAKNVPEGVNVTYLAYNAKTGYRVNDIIYAGTYRVVARFEDVSANYKKIADKEITVTVEKANYDMKAVEFLNVRKEYDGQKYVASINDPKLLPFGVTMTPEYFDYETKEKVTDNSNVGKYLMVANFSGGDTDNYNPIEPMEAILTVTPRVIKIKDKILFDDNIFTYDGEAHSIYIIGNIPNSIKEPIYENNKQIYAGTYLVTAKFEARNSNETVDMESISAYLIIEPIDYIIKVYNEETEAYDLNFSSKNIVVNDGVASVIGIEDTIEVTSMTFLDEDGNEVDPADFVNGDTYGYSVWFSYKDENLAKSINIQTEGGEYVYIEA